MRDLALIIILIGLGTITLMRPWIGVLALAVVGYMHPQGYAWGVARTLPAFEILIFLLTASVLISPETRSVIFLKKRLSVLRDWRLILIGLLWLDFALTSYYSMIPAIAWYRFSEISKVFISLTFTLLLIDTREKLRYLIITIALSIALLATKGGVWAILTGSFDRVYGPPGSHFYDNNHFAVLTVMNIPLLFLWLRQCHDRWIRLFVMVLSMLSVVSALTSWSRGGLIALSVTAMLLVWHSKRKVLAVPFLLLGLFFAVGNLPDEWMQRMGTILRYESEGSAVSRMEVWEEGIRFVLHRPWVGFGPDGWFYAASQDWHSAYIEMLAENGFPGLLLWLSLLVGSIISLSWLHWRSSKSASLELTWLADFSGMLRASLLSYAIGAALLGLSYWDILYQLLVISALLSALAVPLLRQSEPADTSMSIG
ncbi:MAG: putative O-glycosylation ligase, exosortase A system-associated [Chromatiaceae bacterium]|nr:putative O-glycosylation ligase, exosortase A system-associated [Chromatiaceae bacterium]